MVVATIITTRSGSNDKMNLGFQFKQFYVRHDRCAMKVGTDGVLLGAWAEKSPTAGASLRILDIGTGSGLIALMLAQRLPHTQIDAIDIDEAAVEQASDNFRSSPWTERLHAYHSPLQEWRMVNGKWYDLIVSNPPYFQNSLKNPDKGRELARHTDTLSYSELLHHSARLLYEEGRLCLILPAEAENEVCTLAAQAGFVLARATRVYSKVSKPARRVLLAFDKSKSRYTGISASRHPLPIEDTLVLENEKGGRSAAYQELAKDFYL